MCIFSTTRRITSIGHGDPAMMPVRRLVRSCSANRGWSSMAMNIVGTPYNGRAALGLHRAQDRQRVEALAREDHGGTVRDRSQAPEDHAEAVVERHRDADAVIGRELQRLAHEEGVVQDVVVRESRGLGCAGRARGELNVDRVVELKPRRALGQALEIRCVGRL